LSYFTLSTAPIQKLTIGSTGNVWQSRFDFTEDLFVVKTVEMLRTTDVDDQQRHCNEFGDDLSLEKVDDSMRLHTRIAPRCYGELCTALEKHLQGYPFSSERH
jgi:hypothetical protein